MLVVYVLDDELVSILAVNIHNDRLDGRVALDKDPC